MATKKKTPAKRSSKLSKRMHEITEKDIFKSIAIASILFNMLFFAIIVVISNTDTFDHGVYSYVKDRYCENSKNIKQRAELLGSDNAALLELHVNCVSDQFAPFHEEAIEKFKASAESRAAEE